MGEGIGTQTGYPMSIFVCKDCNGDMKVVSENNGETVFSCEKCKRKVEATVEWLLMKI